MSLPISRDVSNYINMHKGLERVAEHPVDLKLAMIYNSVFSSSSSPMEVEFTSERAGASSYTKTNMWYTKTGFQWEIDNLEALVSGIRSEYSQYNDYERSQELRETTRNLSDKGRQILEGLKTVYNNYKLFPKPENVDSLPELQVKIQTYEEKLKGLNAILSQMDEASNVDPNKLLEEVQNSLENLDQERWRTETQTQFKPDKRPWLGDITRAPEVSIEGGSLPRDIEGREMSLRAFCDNDPDLFNNLTWLAQQGLFVPIQIEIALKTIPSGFNITGNLNQIGFKKIDDGKIEFELTTLYRLQKIPENEDVRNFTAVVTGQIPIEDLRNATAENAHFTAALDLE